MKTFYVTTPIYYANSLPHLGHLYTTVVADCVRRYQKQRGRDTYFLTGTDEHGVNVERSAARGGRTPRAHVDQIVEGIKRLFAEFDLDPEHGGYDVFMRTTEEFHYAAVAHLWRTVAASRTPKGRECIYKDFYEGWFCAACATFKTEEEYTKVAPGSEEPPRCLVHETPLDRVSEESYFFRLSDYSEALLELYETRPGFVRPDARRNEVMSFVRSGLQDLSVSRLKSSVSWAIPVPGDERHTIYIWFDALSNYITALGWGNDEQRKAELFDKFWGEGGERREVLHLIGKDILRQHAIYWPAFLMAAGLAQPGAVYAHGIWLDPQGRKMSKTIGNTIDPFLLRRHAGVDAVRYFLLREMAFGQDSKVGYESVIERANSDLASGLGNLSSRTLTMIARYCEGRVPSGEIEDAHRLAAKRAGVDADAQALATALEHARDSFVAQMEELSFHRALETAWVVVARVDKLISESKPWELAKDDAQRQTLNAVLYRAAETLRWLAVMLYPVMPGAANSIWRQLGLTDDPTTLDPATLTWGDLRAGTQLGEISPLFPRLDRKKIMSDIEQEQAEGGTHATQAAVPGAPTAENVKPAPPERGATEADAVPGAPEHSGVTASTVAAPSAPTGGAVEGITDMIGIEDFVKVEMRVGQVLTAERIPKSDKLLRFTVDVGEASPRQILAGIAEHYEPEKLVGKKIAVVSNLKPRKLRGFESQGMVLAASVGEAGRPVLATFDEDVPNGARLK